jgi:hypothetical protein
VIRFCARFEEKIEPGVRIRADPRQGDAMTDSTKPSVERTTGGVVSARAGDGEAVTPTGAFDAPLTKPQMLAKAGPLIKNG